MRYFSILAVVFFLLLFPAPAQTGEIIWTKATDWGEVRVRQLGDLRLMTFAENGVETEESRALVSAPHDPQARYVRQMVAVSSVCFEPDGEYQFFVVGMGAGGLSLALAHHFPSATVTSAEIEPAVVEAARRFFAYRDSDRLRTVLDDARRYLESSEQKYDAIYLDAFAGVEIPESLRSLEFVRLLESRLNPGGAVLANVHFVPEESSLRYQKSLEAVFAHRYMTNGMAQGVGVYSHRQQMTPERLSSAGPLAPLLRPAATFPLEAVEPFRDE